MSERDGGPAFPQSATSNGFPTNAREGMSLRDYFAARSLNGMLASDSSVDRTRVNKARWARVAYAFADAMLTEREKSR